MTKQERLTHANAILATFGGKRGLCITSAASGHLLIEWTRTDGVAVRKRWMTRGSDFHPVWHKKAPWGGTQSTALSQLVRWVLDKPVLPMGTWEWWASPTVRLVNTDTLVALLEAGWPAVAICVLCGNSAEGLDWWNLDGVSGPCCSGRLGCRQNGRAKAKR